MHYAKYIMAVDELMLQLFYSFCYSDEAQNVYIWTVHKYITELSRSQSTHWAGTPSHRLGYTFIPIALNLFMFKYKHQITDLSK